MVRQSRAFSTAVSEYKGVMYDEQSGTWQSIIEANGKEIKGGSFMTEEEAAKSYDVLAQIFHGDNAETNFAKNELASWTPHEETSDGRSKTRERIPIRHRKPLELEEVLQALDEENGRDVSVLDLEGQQYF